MSDATKLPQELQELAMASISAEGLPSAIERQAAAGVAEADAIVLLVDGQVGARKQEQQQERQTTRAVISKCIAVVGQAHSKGDWLSVALLYVLW